MVIAHIRGKEPRQMNAKKYLEAVLRDQTLTADSGEMADIQKHRGEVEALLRTEFKDSSPKIRYAGSKAKGTMIKDSYDLDIACFFPREETGAGETLKRIYENVKKALGKKYSTVAKTSAIRLRDLAGEIDFHIDVVPGRFVEGDDGDVFIFQASAEKERLKTNLDTHVSHIKGSGVTDAIRLMKLWNVRNNLGVKTFVLELLTVDLLNGKGTSGLDDQLRHVWTEIRDNAEDLRVEDPANPSGNDLSSYLDGVRAQLKIAARTAMKSVEADDWKAIFGDVQDDEEEAVKALQTIARTAPGRKQPWCGGQ